MARPKDYPCFDTEEDLAEWNVLNVRATTKIHATSRTRRLPPPCTDCSPEFQSRMLRQGRCSHPETEFRPVFEAGKAVGLRGVWPDEEQ